MDQSSISRRSRKPAKPAKPHRDYPLFPHATGRWAKKVRGKLHYFGPWRDPDGALAEWLRVKDDLLAGRTPRPAGVKAGVTVKFVIDAYLTRKEQLRDSGDIADRTFRDAYAVGLRLADAFGRDRLVSDLRPDDFAALRVSLAATRGPVSIGNEVQAIRSIFKWAFEERIIPEQVLFGSGFKRPSAKTLRIELAKRGARDLQAGEIAKLLETADVNMRAMVLLGVNCGFGNNDCGMLPKSAIDLAGGWINYPRPKTGINRRCKLWPETAEALAVAIQHRRAAKNPEDDGLTFITRTGASWAKGRVGCDPVGLQFKKLLVAHGLHRTGIGFYSLRRTFETVAGETADQVAVDFIMGHVPHAADMSAKYRQRISDDRLIRVAEFVRTWLFGKKLHKAEISD